MRDMVSETLEDAIGRKEGLLGHHMERLQVSQLRRHNSRVAFLLLEMNKYIQHKRKRRDELQGFLAEIPNPLQDNSSPKLIREHLELQHKYQQLQHIVFSKSIVKFQELCNWFVVTTCPSSQKKLRFPYMIRFVSMCNIRYWHELSEARVALKHMWQFVVLASKVLLVDIPYTDLITDQNDPWMSISQFTMNLLSLLVSLGLLVDPPDPVSLFATYDIDTLLFNLCKRKQIQGTKASDPISYRTVHGLVQQMQMVWP